MDKFCVDCKHAVREDRTSLLCDHPLMLDPPDAVYGRQRRSKCLWMRQLGSDKPCGVSGKLWEAKPSFLPRSIWKIMWH